MAAKRGIITTRFSVGLLLSLHLALRDRLRQSGRIFFRLKQTIGPFAPASGRAYGSKEMSSCSFLSRHFMPSFRLPAQAGLKAYPEHAPRPGLNNSKQHDTVKICHPERSASKPILQCGEGRGVEGPMYFGEKGI